MSDRLKRGSTGTRKYKKGSMPGDFSKDYDAINFRNDAADRWNSLNTRAEKRSSGRRRASTPFNRVVGFGGFGNIPKLRK